MSRRTKIVCTIGPASCSPAMLEQLVEAGMNVARLNFSHGTHAERADTIAQIRYISDRVGRPVAILQDLAGPKVRIGRLAAGPVRLEPGGTFTLTTRLVSRLRPHIPVLALTPDRRTLRKMALVCGAVALLMDPAPNAEAMERQAIQGAMQAGLVRDGDVVVITAGLPLHVPGTTNSVKVAVAY